MAERRQGTGVLKRVLVWLLEVLGEALGTCLLLIVLAKIEYPGGRNDLDLGHVFGMTAIVLLEFAITGFLATTFVFRVIFWRVTGPMYPAVAAGLYLFHSTISLLWPGTLLFGQAIWFCNSVERAWRLHVAGWGLVC